MADHLTPLDAAFLELEDGDESSHMHVGWTLLFEPVPGGGAPALAEVRDLIGERLGALPRFSRRLSSPRVGRMTWPEWVEEPRLDLANHVRQAQLPDPGGEAELLDWLGDYYSHRLDRAHPLWEVTVLEGLEGGRWALACKVHHCLVDGMTGALIAGLMLDIEPDPGPDAPTLLDSLPPAPAGDPGTGSALGALARSARAGLDTALHPSRLREMLGRSAGLAELLVREELSPAPPSSLNVDIGGTRRLAEVTVPLADLKRIRRVLGGTVNDVVLAACTGALRQLLQSRDEPLPREGLRAQVPVSVREASETLSLGNRVSSLFVRLPVAAVTPSSRLRETRRNTAQLKAGHEKEGADALVDLAGVAPPLLHATLARLTFTPRLFNLTITNVPGPQATLFAFGAPMIRVIPLVPIFAGHSIGIAVVSYDGQVTFGLNADRVAVRDLDVLEHGLADSLDELRAVASRTDRLRHRALVAR